MNYFKTCPRWIPQGNDNMELMCLLYTKQYLVLELVLEMPNDGTAATLLAKGQKEIIRNWTRNRPTKIITRYRSA